MKEQLMLTVYRVTLGEVEDKPLHTIPMTQDIDGQQTTFWMEGQVELGEGVYRFYIDRN